VTTANRDACILETLKWEGGYSNDPGDSGGPTNWGITIWDARKYWRKTATAADVRAMPRSIAVQIYENKYWKTPYYDCDHLHDGVDLAVFDYGVNSGPSRARAALMAAVGGPDSETIRRICAYRMTFLHNLNIWRLFGKGWARRVAGIQAVALKMSANPTKPISIPEPKEPPVATPTPAPTLPISIDAGSILQLLLNNLPALLEGVGKFYPPLAPVVAVVSAVKDAMVKIPASDGSLAAIEKILAAEMYAVAIALDPTLTHPKA
jgi:lysozyme family protein